jgi:hypothetical protein
VLRDYASTLLFVSHDRYFIDAVATEIWAVEDAAVRIYPGAYSDYADARAKGLPSTPASDEPPAGIAAARSTRRDGPSRPVTVVTVAPQGFVRDEEVAVVLQTASQLEQERHALAGRLARLQGQSLDSLVALAEEHAQAQHALAAEDDRLMAALRRAIG